jgi:hypothetical protein
MKLNRALEPIELLNWVAYSASLTGIVKRQLLEINTETVQAES